MTRPNPKAVKRKRREEGVHEAVEEIVDVDEAEDVEEGAVRLEFHKMHVSVFDLICVGWAAYPTV